MRLENNAPNEDTEVGLSAGTPSEADIERLGRQRPDAFRTLYAEVAFCFSLLASMFMAVSGLLSMLILADAPLRTISSAASG